MAETDKTATPPWGDDFDAEKAWELITTLRAAEKTLKTERNAFKAERDELAVKVQGFEDAGKTEAEKADAKAQADAAELAKARRDLFVERALRKHAIPEELVEFLTGDDEESILAKAEKLAGLKSAKPDADATDTDAADAAASGRPKPGLKPGEGGDAPEEVDLDALVASIR
ncbi:MULTISPECIES: hypothetical protein [unclassified Microbacterium]|uniref:hypothetical protein n=1 Tax=unclassified Microbacterium TaxID=2609290 RepID=UPI00042079BB|nr:hypothetical protein [Microbacterium sp. B24]